MEYVRVNNDVRISCLGIGKIVNKVKETVYAEMGIGLSVAYSTDKIVKHNKNIKELLEVGDIVEYTVGNMKNVYISTIKKYGKGVGIDHYSLEQINIKKILTKQQYELNCFRLEET